MSFPSGLWLWFVLAVGRFLWALLPQTGYIHPDEFFQSVEIVAGEPRSVSMAQIVRVVRLQILCKIN